ncbi:hypothetical protein [Glycomyces arizonensis]|uniref:hypothetical protein n=1 Tax=Glycomyces arizonensis TaxID=256035 RepID=UPI00041B6543|nr:hypothetical protein [Glycomyces arizonensis]
MAPWLRLLAVVPPAVALLVSSGCSDSWGCTDTTAERGEAAAEVDAVGTDGEPLGVTVAILDWELSPHPQTPDEGDMVDVTYSFDYYGESYGDALRDVGLQLCAVDADRVALSCAVVYSTETRPESDRLLTGESWLGPEHPERTAEVLLIPNNMIHHRVTCEGDPKDGGGTHPPEHLVPGDQL